MFLTAGPKEIMPNSIWAGGQSALLPVQCDHSSYALVPAPGNMYGHTS